MTVWLSTNKRLIPRRGVLTAVVALLLLAFRIPALLALEVPPYRGYVNDYGDMISPAMERSLETTLRDFDRSDSTQVAILTVPSLEGDALERFSIRVADLWKVGRKGRDNGVLLLVARADREMRLEVGRGLEPVLTDLLSGRIIDHVIAPHFKSGDSDRGFEAGVTAIIQATRGEFKAEDLSRRGSRDEVSPLFRFFFFAIMITAFLGSQSRMLGAVAGGLLLPLALAFGLLPSFPLVILLLLIPAGALGGWLLPLFLSGFFRGGGGFYGGGRRRGFYGGVGGGSGGGGFGGFGGGGFGGGGASGRW